MLMSTKWLYVGALFAVLIIGTSILGGVRAFSAIPFWDMWDGQLNFYLRINQGEWAAWTDQHNEHRIILTRILFWIDLYFLGGDNRFLIIINYVLVAINSILFYRILRNFFIEDSSKNNKIFIGFFITAWLFQWMQSQNLIWAFQSQFFLVQTLALACFYSLSKAIDPLEKNSHIYFLVSCILGLVSVWTMANGLAVLPLMLIFLLLCRQSVVKVGIVVLLFTLSFSLYFLDYKTPGNHSSAPLTFLGDPVGVLKYVSLYLGGPFYYLGGGGEFGKILGYIFGLFLLLSTAYFTYSFIRNYKDKNYQLALYFYILFVVLTAFMTAGGRLNFGVEQALESRYTTPALMAWAALIIMGISKIRFAHVGIIQFNILLLALCAISYGMLLAQLQAFKPPYEMLHERNLAALALSMDVRDQKRVSRIYPSIERALEISARAHKNNISIFPAFPYQEFRERPIGTIGQNVNLPKCIGFLDGVESIVEDPRFVIIRGWVFNSEAQAYPDFLRFLDSNDGIVGYAITGGYRPDVAGQVNKNALLSGFDGYISSSSLGSTLLVQAGNLSCQISLNIPKRIYLSDKLPLGFLEGLVDTKSILGGNKWVGSDFYNSKAPKVKVYGSYINGDVDMGSILIKVGRGQKIFYRSGPTGGRQLLQVNEDASLVTILPTSLEWTLLDFSGLPENKEGTLLRFIDNGNSWGEWSAIGLSDGSKQ
jgi:hypothetical protein